MINYSAAMGIARMKTRILVLGLALPFFTAGCNGAEPKPSSEMSAPTNLFSQSLGIASPQPGTTIVLTINGKQITRADVDREAAGIAARLRSRIPPERLAQMRPRIEEEAINGLIYQELLKAAVDAEKITVSEDEISNAISTLAKSLPQGVSMDQHLESIGMQRSELEDAVRFDIGVRKLLAQKVPPAKEPTEEEIKAFYEKSKERFTVPERVKARHILVAVEKSDDEASRKAKLAKAEKIRKQLLDGADFAELAKKESDCPSKARGGDLGTFTRGQMVPAFEKAAFSQKPGEIGPVVETRFGYHIIQVMDHQEGKTLSLDETHDQIAAVVKNRQHRKAVNEYLGKLKAAADIRYAAEPASAPALPSPTSAVAE